MIHSTRAPAIVLLVALAFFVGVSPPLFALDRLPEHGQVPGYSSAQTPPDVTLVTDDGDPDDWASNTGEGEGPDGVDQSKPGERNWLDYLESVRDLILRIKLGLDGIL
jgi:hypothetical protein